MERRNLIALGVIIAAVITALILQLIRAGDDDGAVESVAALPTFSVAPSPLFYDSIGDLAAALTAGGVPCDPDEQDTEQISSPLKGFAECNLFAEPSYNISIWLFEDEEQKRAWLAGSASVLRLVGPNWMIVPEDLPRAGAIQGVIGGKVMEPATPSM